MSMRACTTHPAYYRGGYLSHWLIITELLTGRLKDAGLMECLRTSFCTTHTLLNTVLTMLVLVSSSHIHCRLDFTYSVYHHWANHRIWQSRLTLVFSKRPRCPLLLFYRGLMKPVIPSVAVTTTKIGVLLQCLPFT